MLLFYFGKGLVGFSKVFETKSRVSSLDRHVIGVALLIDVVS